MPDPILRHRIGPPAETGEKRCRPGTRQRGEFFRSRGDELCIIERRHFRLQRAPKEHPGEYHSSRCASGIFETRKATSNYFSTLDRRNNKAKTLRQVSNVILAESHIHRSGRGIFDTVKHRSQTAIMSAEQRGGGVGWNRTNNRVGLYAEVVFYSEPPFTTARTFRRL